ncbi:hypothetical protein MOE48_11815 [Bacillus inaquosorum]|uniref:hypothetical protein n=1 Tax=Bacillus inaquosorum TaxID=483913 RepID=UPI0022802BCB|nr:hypothetical protein [Bacillus inaquosorum]MCY9015779.1 hypothetical protein [Bacillus inaquosorum]MCY9041985.1 hypothetical protein [Bacillus inaquosorum]MCY9105366.1 hypothetical protein [Bacillus inaquosorum]MCY9123073.1 hypothetical protein [Bacillus inaquosorum]
MYSTQEDQEIINTVLRKIGESSQLSLHVKDFNELGLTITRFYIDTESSEEAKRLHDSLPEASVKGRLDNNSLEERILKALDKSRNLTGIKELAQSQSRGRVADFSKIRFENPSFAEGSRICVTFFVPYR